MTANVTRGCVTPKLISNMAKTFEEDGDSVEDLDGFDEISEDNQQRIRKALEQGHVDDDDWKGVSASFLLPSCVSVFSGLTTVFYILNMR